MFTVRSSSSDQFKDRLTTEPVADRFTYEYLNSPTGGTGDISTRTGTTYKNMLNSARTGTDCRDFTENYPKPSKIELKNNFLFGKQPI